MGQRRKYEDREPEEKILDTPEHTVRAVLFGPRRFDPTIGAGVTSVLVDMSTGDWSWKPHRNALFPQNGMPAYKPARHPLAGIRF